MGVARYFVLLLIFFAGCQKKQEEEVPVKVTAFQVEPETVPATFHFVGVAQSSHQVDIRSRVEGYLLSIDYTEGGLVEEGQLLFRIDPRQFEASLEGAEGELARQEAKLWRAKRSLERIEPLYEQNAASERDRDNALAQVLSAEASVIAAKANVIQAELNLSYTYICSPICGMSGRASHQEGALITPTVNGLLTQVSVINPIWVLFSISDDQLLMARAEGESQRLILPQEQEYTVTLELADGSTFPYTGEVNFAAPTLDKDTGSLVVRAQFDNPKGELLPGQFVRATVEGAEYPDALFVPQQAVSQGRKGMYVFVIDENNIVSMRDVKVGDWYGEYWMIEEGLDPGDLVVVEGVNKVQDGSHVEIASLESPEQTT